MRSFFYIKDGFSLVEAALVLGVIGLVIGGIWVAADSVRQNQRINETANDILQISSAARKLLPYYSYPTTNPTNTDITQIALNAGITTNNFKILNAYNAENAVGVVFSIRQACYSTCPMLSITLRGPGETSPYAGKLTPANCRQLVRRFAGLMRNNSDLISIQIQTFANSSYQILYPPIDGNAVDCPDNMSAINFWFKP